jgi:hypothetical protein
MVFAAAAARAPAPAPPRRPYIDNQGRVVSQSERPPSFSKRRFLFLLIVGLAFWLTNPANAPFTTTLETIYRDYLEPVGFPASSSSSLPPGAKTTKKTLGDRGSQHVTNFGFFSVNERITRVELHALGTKVDCRFGDETFGWFCQALQADLCHQKPLFWDPHDRPYTTHRLFSWSLVATGMVAFFLKDPSALRTGNLLVDSFLTIWFPSDSVSSSSPLFASLRAIWQSTFFLYPVWIRLDTLVPIQHPNSWFRVVDDHAQNDWNYALSIVFVLLLAAGSNAASKMVTGRFLLRDCDAVVAVALGYYRGSLAEVSAATAVTFPVLSSLSVNLTALHWTAVLTMLTRMDASVFFWLYANMLGAFMGEYQYRNQFTLALARQVWRSLENTLDAFFGYR